METDRLDFKQSYNRYAESLTEVQTHDEAMSTGVGMEFETMGRVLGDLVRFCGLQPDHSLVDIGCGSGRLTKQLASYLHGPYLGIDVVPAFLENARKFSQRPDWRFEEAEGLSIPAPPGTVDMVCFFSVITHLLHQESYLYLEDAWRVLKPGGKVVVSFLEFFIPSHWAVFQPMIEQRRVSPDFDFLNQFVCRDGLRAWAQYIGFDVIAIWDGDKPFVPLSAPIRFDDGRAFETFASPGQSVCLLQKRQ